MEEIHSYITRYIFLIILISSAILYPYYILIGQYTISFNAIIVTTPIIIVILLFLYLYFTWAHSWIIQTRIAESGLFTSREKMSQHYMSVLGKGYFIPWSEIVKIILSKDAKTSDWKCVFTTKYQDIIEISSALKYPDTCVPKLIELGNKLKIMGIEVVISDGILKSVSDKVGGDTSC